MCPLGPFLLAQSHVYIELLATYVLQYISVSQYVPVSTTFIELCISNFKLFS